MSAPAACLSGYTRTQRADAISRVCRKGAALTLRPWPWTGYFDPPNKNGNPKAAAVTTGFMLSYIWLFRLTPSDRSQTAIRPADLDRGQLEIVDTC